MRKHLQGVTDHWRVVDLAERICSSEDATVPHYAAGADRSDASLDTSPLTASARGTYWRSRERAAGRERYRAA
jgi:hypothetical protein